MDLEKTVFFNFSSSTLPDVDGVCYFGSPCSVGVLVAFIIFGASTITSIRYAGR